ncbi:MAG: hypothetical protein LBS83_02200 [Holosporales bacterium]|nr:hypothetical protein [Holosporales bacterium]
MGIGMMSADEGNCGSIMCKDNIQRMVEEMKVWASKPMSPQELERYHAVKTVSAFIKLTSPVLYGSAPVPIEPSVIDNLLKALAYLSPHESVVGRIFDRDGYIFGLLFSEYWGNLKKRIIEKEISNKTQKDLVSVISLLPEIMRKVETPDDVLIQSIETVIKNGQADINTLVEPETSNFVERAGQNLLEDRQERLSRENLYY